MDWRGDVLKKALLILLFAAILSGCTDTEAFDFEGESDHWKVTYTVEIHGDRLEHKAGQIEYIGVEPTPKEEVSYVIKNNTAGLVLLDDKGISKVGGSSGDCSKQCIVDESEIMEATIGWEGNEEKIELSYGN